MRRLIETAQSSYVSFGLIASAMSELCPLFPPTPTESGTSLHVAEGPIASLRTEKNTRAFSAHLFRNLSRRGRIGEDDLDAPDLVTPTASDPAKPKESAKARLNGGTQAHRDHRAFMRRNGRTLSGPAMPMLAPDASAQLWDRLLAELEGLANSDEAALWAQRSLPEKNKLTTADAQRVEDALQTRLAI